MPARSKFYQRVREARKRTGLSLEHLAGEVGVSRGALAQWEMVEGTAPSVENLVALARCSGMAFEYLATGRGAKIHGQPILPSDEERARYQLLTPQQKRLCAAFEALTPKQRAGLLDLIETSAGKESPRIRR